MKNLRTAVLCACIALSSFSSFAQEKTVPVNEPDLNKPKLFAAQPDKIQLNTTDLEGLFDVPVGRSTSIRLSEDSRFQFEGQVVSTGSQEQERLHSMIIRSTNFNGARFTLSRITHHDGSITYVGRIVSMQHGDVYELQNHGGTYSLVKKNFYDLINE